MSLPQQQQQQQLRYHGIVLGEIMEMTRVMRQNRKWKSSANAPIESDSWLMQGFESLRTSLTLPNGISSDFDRLQIIKPFVAAVRSEEATGPITGAALTSLHKFISANLFAANFAHSASAILEIADAGTHCRFEATDSGNDELVLMKILQVHLACFSVENGVFLADTTVWEMVQTCFRIYRQMKPPEYSQLLSDRARQSLYEMTRLLFSSRLSHDGGSLHNDSTSIHESNSANMSQHFGIPCMVKVLGSLISMGRSSLTKTQMFGQRQQTVLVLQLVLNALEFGVFSFDQDQALLGLIQDDLCFFLLQNARSARSSVISLVSRIFHCILVNFRHLLKTQVESILNTVFLGCRDSPYEIREIILNSLLDFAHYPWFIRELYVNYDCSPRSTNVLENLVLFLCDSTVPHNGHINSNNILAVRCLDTIMQSFVQSPPKSYPSFNIEELLCSKKQKTTIFNCVSLFNKKPKHGFTALAQAGIMDSLEDSETAAQILFHTPIVNKSTLGEFLGSPSSFVSDVRTRFISYFDFRSKDVVDALRICLEGFRLPAEAQQIDRVVQSFSEHYYSHNTRDFANADVIHILTFALIMLNTDAHNGGIKNKMTLEQFTKNLRGINNGESFPDEYLEVLYKSIVSEELKISKSGPGGDFSRSLWTELLAKSRAFGVQEYLQLTGSDMDVDIFRMIWEPVCSAMSLLFDVSQSERVSELCLSTFESIGTASCIHQLPDTVDTIISFCCQLSGLLNSEIRLEDAVLAIGRSQLKTQASIRLIFYQPFINSMHASWNLWICVLYQLLRLSLLPSSFFILDDFVYSEGSDPARRRLSFPDYIEKPVSLQSLISSVQSFWMLANDQAASDTKSADQIESARETAKEFIAELHIEDLLTSTSKIPSDSFICLVNALTFATKQEMSISSSDALIIDEKAQYYRSFPRLEQNEELLSKQLIFFLQLLTRLVIINRDRSLLCLNEVASHLFQLFHSQFPILDSSYFESFNPVSFEALSPSDDLAEAAVVASLQLLLRLKCQDTPWFPSFLLKLLVAFDIFGHAYENVGKQAAFALHIFSQNDAILIRTADDWTIIFALLERCAASPSTSTNGFEALACLLSNQNCNAFAKSTVFLSIESLLKFAQSKAVPVGERLRAIDYLQLIYGRLPTLDLRSEPGESDQPMDFLVSCNMEIFEALRLIICNSEKFSLREHALSTLQHLLLSPEAKRLPSDVWKNIFDKVVINLITVLGLTRSSSHYLSKCRCAVTAFACRIFLIYLPQLLTLKESDFKTLWCSLLSELLSFLDLESDTPSYSLLAETVVESLKNTLRVMSASDIEGSFGADLWEITWQTIDPFLPQLKDEVFPRELPPPNETKPDPPAAEPVVSSE